MNSCRRSMSCLSRSTFRSTLAASPAPRASSLQASISTTSRRFVGQESSLHNEDRAEEAERHKQDQLKKQKQGKNEWTPELASDSEHHIKADKEGHDASPDKIKQMQEDTKHVPAQKAGQK